MNELNHHHASPKKLKNILIIISIIFVGISIFGVYFFPWFWILVVPLSFLLYAAFQATSDHLVEYKKICPRCKTKNDITSDVCYKCGFEFPLYEKDD